LKGGDSGIAIFKDQARLDNKRISFPLHPTYPTANVTMTTTLLKKIARRRCPYDEREVYGSGTTVCVALIRNNTLIGCS